MYEKFKDFQLVIFGLILGLSFLIGANIITKHISKGGIYVTGSSFAIVKSDSASWMIQFTTRGKTNADAYNALKSQLPTVLTYLKSNGIPDEQIDIAPASSYTTFKTDPKTGYSTGDIAYYNYNQAIKVSDDDVQLIKRLSNSIQELNSKGIELSSNSPEYQYSKMSELKVKLLQEATKDSKERAKAMLKANNNRVGKILSVKMGVFQITTPDSNSVSDEGINDSSTIEKKVTAVANVFYQIK